MEKELQNKVFLLLQQRNAVSKGTKFIDISPNVYFYDWESDLLFQNMKGNFYEMEIKSSVQDFENDFTKSKKHKKLKSAFEGNAEKVPSFFYYVIPESIIESVSIPEYAGLYVYRYFEGELDLILIKEAPKLTEYCANAFDKIKILRSVYFKYWRQRAGQTFIL